MKYRKKPVVIEAVKWNGINKDEIEEFAGNNVKIEVIRESDSEHNIPPCICCIIQTLEGTMAASTGDYIIKEANGEFYPCKPDIFAKTYDVEDGPVLDQESKRSIFVETATPLVKFLYENYHPHATVIVTPTGAELVEGIECFSTDKYILD